MPNRRIIPRIPIAALVWLSVGPGVLMASSSTSQGPATRPAANAIASIDVDRRGDEMGSQSSVAAADGSAEDRNVRRRTPASTVHHGQVARRPAEGQSWYARGLIALAVVLGMIGAAAYAVKRWGGRLRLAVGAGDKSLELVSRLSLSPKQSVCLVRVGPQMVLVGVTPDRLTALGTIDEPETVGELLASAEASRPDGTGGGFSGWFSRESERYEDMGVNAEPAAEVPMTNASGHYRDARAELSGLLDKIRSRGDRAGRDMGRPGDDGDTVAIA